jgi:class 3 adenylate cyclase
VRDHAIVSSLFPKTVLDRFFQAEEKKRMSLFEPTNLKIKSFQQIGDNGDTSMKQSNHDGTIVPIESRPIADLFPETTIMFADIAGFTAWSSVREPAQVFTLLETIYSAFDKIANRRAVFKVETIGDSYVAVVGLPEPRKDHAVVMVKFATDCRSRFQELTSDLKVTLGPETGDLRLRLGLHSGPVTAGVLRGQKSRFQLFGDTVNTASRMESTGVPNRVQVSQTTADLLVRADKGHWLQLRDKKVEVKGKGLMQTYWAEPKAFSPLPTTNVDT